MELSRGSLGLYCTLRHQPLHGLQAYSIVFSFNDVNVSSHKGCYSPVTHGFETMGVDSVLAFEPW